MRDQRCDKCNLRRRWSDKTLKVWLCRKCRKIKDNPPKINITPRESETRVISGIEYEILWDGS